MPTPELEQEIIQVPCRVAIITLFIMAMIYISRDDSTQSMAVSSKRD